MNILNYTLKLETDLGRLEISSDNIVEKGEISFENNALSTSDISIEKISYVVIRPISVPFRARTFEEELLMKRNNYNHTDAKNIVEKFGLTRKIPIIAELSFYPSLLIPNNPNVPTITRISILSLHQPTKSCHFTLSHDSGKEDSWEITTKGDILVEAFEYAADAMEAIRKQKINSFIVKRNFILH